jgi:hypothetical protein
MSSIDREEYLIPADGIDHETIMSTVRRALADGRWKDREKVHALSLRSQENIRLIVDLLKEGRKSRERFFLFLPVVPAFALSNYLMDMSHSVRDLLRGQGPSEG